MGVSGPLGVDTGAVHYALHIMHKYGIPLEPTFKIDTVNGGMEIVKHSSQGEESE